MRRRDLSEQAAAFVAAMPEATRAALKAELEAAGPESVANNLEAIKQTFRSIVPGIEADALAFYLAVIQAMSAGDGG